MKIKKKISLLLSVFLTYMPCSLWGNITEKIIVGQPPRDLGEIERMLDNETPMQANVRNLKSMFEDKMLPAFSLKGRVEVVPSKTTQFNKSFLKYIKEIYNENNYAETLSQNGEHIKHFLEVSSEINLDIETNYVCIRLFYNKFKECEIIDDTMLNQIIPCLIKHLDRFFYSKCDDSKKIDINSMRKNIEATIISKFTTPLSEFQKVDSMTQMLTNEIMTVFKNEIDRSEREFKKIDSRERLRKVIMSLLEITLNKVIWDPKSPAGIWQSFLELSNNIKVLGLHEIVDSMDDLDDLLWSLSLRFCYFLDLAGAVLPLDFYEEVERDLKNKTVFFLETQEQDFGIMTKKEKLAQAIIQAKTKAYAYQKMGLFTQPV